MGKVTKRLPSPSMAVAFIALLAALGGTAAALPGKNSVKSDDIAKNAVRSSDIKASNVTTSDVKNSSLRGSDVRANTLTGSDISEGSLGTVPSANAANSANTANFANSAGAASTADSVGGVKLRPINFLVPDTVGTQTILNAGGLQINADCTGGDVDLLADTTSNDGAIRSYFVNDGGTIVESVEDDGNFDAADAPLDLIPSGTENDLHGNLVYTSENNNSVTIQWQVDDINPAGGAPADCMVTGQASFN